VVAHGKKGATQGILVSFSGALDPASAQNLGHYLLRVPGKGKKHKTRTVAITKAVYNTTANTVLLTLGKLKSTDRQGTLLVQGLTDPSGNLLAAAAFAVNLSPKRKR
jgi:hypothetical protein